MGWPEKELPEDLTVTVDMPPVWGAKAVLDERGTFRVNISNKQAKDLHLLNLWFREPRLLLVKEDGQEVPLEVSIKKLESPSSNPGLTLGSTSTIGFKVAMERPVVPADFKNAKIVFEVKIQFVAGDIVEKKEQGSGYLDGFTYTAVRRLSGADRLLKFSAEAKPAPPADGKRPSY